MTAITMRFWNRKNGWKSGRFPRERTAPPGEGGNRQGKSAKGKSACERRKPPGWKRKLRRWRKKIQEIQEAMCRPEVLRDPERIRELKGQLEEHEERLAKKTDRWVELAE